MAKRGGYSGGMPANMGNLMKQAQKMQRQMEAASKEMEEAEVTAASGGGAVEVKMNGNITLSEEVVDPEDIEMLEDLIMAAVNEASNKVDAMSEESMSKITGGLGGLGGGFPF